MWEAVTAEALRWNGDSPVVTAADIDRLEEMASRNERKRCRFLLHDSPEDTLHEMVIALRRGTYIPPHINPHSPKSYVLLRGSLMVATFEEDGTLRKRQPVAAGESGQPSVIRLPPAVWHMAVPTSDSVVYVEMVLGPHRATAFAPWAPPTERQEDGAAFMQSILDAA